MSIFNEIILKVNDISDSCIKNFDDDIKVAFEGFAKFQEVYITKNGGRGKAQKDKSGTKNLQSINEDEVEPPKAKVDTKSGHHSGSSGRGSAESLDERRAPKKRSKNEVDDMSSPEVDKRQKRNASVKAQSNITKQVNTNLTAKMRREASTDKVDKPQKQAPKSRRRKDEEKENTEPNVPLAIQIKEEKISIPPEPMDMDALPSDIEIKLESDKDNIAMPPPAIPVPKPRKGIVKEKSADSADEDSGTRRSTRTKKQDAVPPPPPVASKRATRASNRTRQTESEELPPPPAETRPKRTRAKKKISVSSNETDSAQSQEFTSATSSPAEKPRPKRTRRGKAAEKQEPPQPVETILPKEERISQPDISSPIIPQKTKHKKRSKNDLISTTIESTISVVELEDTKVIALDNTSVIGQDMDQTKIIAKDMDKTTVIGQDCIDEAGKGMDKTVVLPNGVHEHATITPKNHNINETVVIEKCPRYTSIDKPMDATVVIDKGSKPTNVTDDNSLITDDESEQEKTPPKKAIPETQPSSAVKEKVQQFEEMASRVTRTKTRAMAKKEETVENQTPPDKVIKPVLSAETLTKMNSLIFNGKAQVSSSATKARAALPKSLIPSSTSKLSSISKHKEAADLTSSTSTSKLSAIGHKDEEDARKKKEAMLEAKRELHKRKREEKMAAAAAARNAAERERKALLEAAARERVEKQASADAGKLQRLKDAERKKQDLARKVAETEERRKAEEAARMQRLAEEQRRALEQRKKQIEEQEAMKKEAAIMQREIEKRQKEYNEKQKKQRLDSKLNTPLKCGGTPGGGVRAVLEPVYMMDGFQYLNSDEDEEPPPRPVPEWSTSKARKLQLDIQSRVSIVHVDRLFSVRVHSPDLRDIFPTIERARLKRTSSAVWRTPPAPPAPLRTLRE